MKWNHIYVGVLGCMYVVGDTYGEMIIYMPLMQKCTIGLCKKV